MKQARRKTAPHPVFELIAAMRQVADNPDEGEGALRETVRQAATVLVQQHRLIEMQRRTLVWTLGPLAVLFGLLTAYQIARLVWGLP